MQRAWAHGRCDYHVNWTWCEHSLFNATLNWNQGCPRSLNRFCSSEKVQSLNMYSNSRLHWFGACASCAFLRPVSDDVSTEVQFLWKRTSMWEVDMQLTTVHWIKGYQYHENQFSRAWRCQLHPSSTSTWVWLSCNPALVLSVWLCKVCVMYELALSNPGHLGLNIRLPDQGMCHFWRWNAANPLCLGTTHGGG